MHRVFYVYADKSTTGAQAQLNAFDRAGLTGPKGRKLAKKDCFLDKDGSREERQNLLDLSKGLGGDVVVHIACAAYIGKPGRDRAKVLRILAERNVRVAILDGDPELYDTPIKRAAFLEEAEAVARKDNGKTRGPKNRGRPPAVRLTLDQWREVLKEWRLYDDKREAYLSRPYIRAKVADFSTENGLKIEAEKVKDDLLHSWFGKRADTSDREPPKQLWKAEE